jgi:hypothetical protein
MAPSGARRNHPEGMMPGYISEGESQDQPPTARTDVMTASTENSNGWPTFRSGLLITGGSLIGAGALIALAGLAVSGAHVVSATRQWIREMEVPPSELARIKWAQARSAATAGATAWQNGVSARDTAGT